MNVQQIYRYSFEMNYVLDNEVHEISQDLIKYAIVDYDYDGKNMPVIYIYFTTTKEIFDKMDHNIDKGYISLVIRKRQENASSSLWSDYIEGQFTYFILTDSEETNQTWTVGDDKNPLNGDEFKLVELALLKTDIMNKTKKVYNTVLSSVRLIDAVHYGTYHMPMVIEPVNNVYFESLIIPPISTTSKYLKYINNIREFYNTPYRFFVDFSRGYLLSSSGIAIPTKGDIANSIIIVEDIIEPVDSKFSGQEFDNVQKHYTIRVTKNEIVEIKNNIANKSVNRMVGVSSSGNVRSRDIDSLEDVFGTRKTSFVRISNENMQSLENKSQTISNQSLYISVSKGEIDTSIITPNMEYNYRSLEVPRYNGRYLLSRKREVFKQTDGAFVVDVTIVLKKIMTN